MTLLIGGRGDGVKGRTAIRPERAAPAARCRDDWVKFLIALVYLRLIVVKTTFYFISKRSWYNRGPELQRTRQEEQY
jgi:hypothetical protein